MDSLLLEKRNLEAKYRTPKTEVDKAKAELDAKTAEIIVEWRKTNPVYWTIRCTAHARDSFYRDFNYERGCFSSENTARDFLSKCEYKQQNMAHHTISYSIAPVSTAQLKDIPVFDFPCDLWYYEK